MLDSSKWIEQGPGWVQVKEPKRGMKEEQRKEKKRPMLLKGQNRPVKIMGEDRN